MLEPRSDWRNVHVDYQMMPVETSMPESVAPYVVQLWSRGGGRVADLEGAIRTTYAACKTVVEARGAIKAPTAASKVASKAASGASSGAASGAGAKASQSRAKSTAKVVKSAKPQAGSKGTSIKAMFKKMISRGLDD